MSVDDRAAVRAPDAATDRPKSKVPATKGVSSRTSLTDLLPPPRELTTSWLAGGRRCLSLVELCLWLGFIGAIVYGLIAVPSFLSSRCHLESFSSSRAASQVPQFVTAVSFDDRWR